MGIQLEQPALSVNAHDAGFPSYKMWRTIDAPAGTTAGTTAGWIFSNNMDALRTQGTQLRNIVLNAHGYPGKVSIGGMQRDGIYIADLSLFAILKPMNVGTIWLCGCRAAEGGLGINFCQALAMIAGTQIIASDKSQEVTPYQGYTYLVGRSGQIDDYEGTVYSFTPAGAIRVINPQRDVWTVKS